MSGQRQHSIVRHKSNYFYLPLEDDYLAMYETLAEQVDPLKEKQGEKPSGPSDCKAMIASIFEGWMNNKRSTASDVDELFSYFTIDQIVQQLRHRYKRGVVMHCLNEMAEEGTYTDPETGEEYRGTLKKRPHIQNMYAYALNLPVIQALLDALDEQSPYGLFPRPALGRPKKAVQKRTELKSSPKINGINLDCLNGNQSKKGLNNPKSGPKKDGSYYITQNQLTQNQLTQKPIKDADADTFFLTSEENKTSLFEQKIADLEALFSQQIEQLKTEKEQMQAQLDALQQQAATPSEDTSYSQNTAISSQETQETPVKRRGRGRPARQKETPPELPTPKEDPLAFKTPEEERFWGFWCNADQNRRLNPKRTPTAMEHVRAMAPLIVSQEKMDSLVTSTREYFRVKLKQPKLWMIQLGHAYSHFPDWDHEQIQQEELFSTPPPEEENKLVLWTKHSDDIHGLLEDYWFYFEYMPLKEANEHYEYDTYGPLVPQTRRIIEKRMDEERQGIRERPLSPVA